MAKTIKKHKGFTIKETTPKDNTTYKYQVFTKDEPTYPEWECDSLKEATDFIDSYDV